MNKYKAIGKSVGIIGFLIYTFFYLIPLIWTDRNMTNNHISVEECGVMMLSTNPQEVENFLLKVKENNSALMEQCSIGLELHLKELLNGRY